MSRQNQVYQDETNKRTSASFNTHTNKIMDNTKIVAPPSSDIHGSELMHEYEKPFVNYFLAAQQTVANKQIIKIDSATGRISFNSSRLQ